MSTSGHVGGLVAASMKAPPKRKGNGSLGCNGATGGVASMKVPIEKRRNLATDSPPTTLPGLNESLHLKVQNKRSRGHLEGILICLIESPYKTVGKFELSLWLWSLRRGLIKGPSHKEGKSRYFFLAER